MFLIMKVEITSTSNRIIKLSLQISSLCATTWKIRREIKQTDILPGEFNNIII